AAVLSTTVHEANNALQIISGSAELLDAGAAPSIVARRGEAIGSQARRASALLAELSAFAREDAPDVKCLDLAQMAQRALTMRQYTLARLNIQPVFESAGELSQAVARPRPVLQIILNLLLNAERALADRKGGRIAIAATGRDQNVQLVVDDNGPGLS